MASYNLMPSDVTTALSGQNVYVAAGSVGAPPQNPKQAFETGILVNSMLNKPEQYENLIVKNVPGTDKMIYVKDIGRVELAKFTYSGGSFVDGNRCSLLMIYQSPGSNALQTADNVYAKLADLKKTFPPDVEYVVPFESVTIIQVSMQEVSRHVDKGAGIGCPGCIYVPAKLALYYHSDIGHPGIHFVHFLFFHPVGLYHQYAHHVWVRARYRYSG
jgi:multidrug efflux pump subunit AcrB